MFRTARSLLLIAAGMLICACAGSGEVGGGGAIDTGRWTLTFYDVDGRATPVPKVVRADARFEDGRVAGSAGCNAYQASYTRTGTKLTVGPIAATKRFCEGAAGEVESGFLLSLARADSFSASPEKLIVSDETGRALLEFAAAPDNPLLGPWEVTGYNNGAGAVVSVAIGTKVTANFGADGMLHGSGGCNDYSGSYILDGERLSVGPLATTRKACDERVMEQEDRFLAALQAATGYRLEPHIVVLLLSDGASGVSLAR